MVKLHLMVRSVLSQEPGDLDHTPDHTSKLGQLNLTSQDLNFLILGDGL